MRAPAATAGSRIGCRRAKRPRRNAVTMTELLNNSSFTARLPVRISMRSITIGKKTNYGKVPGRAAIAAVLTFSFVFAWPQGAFAAKAEGYRECTGAQTVRVVSSTYETGIPGLFMLTHTANGQAIGRYTTAGHNSTNSGSLAANWTVETNGGINSASASCAL